MAAGGTPSLGPGGEGGLQVPAAAGQRQAGPCCWLRARLPAASCHTDEEDHLHYKNLFQYLDHNGTGWWTSWSSKRA